MAGETIETGGAQAPITPGDRLQNAAFRAALGAARALPYAARIRAFGTLAARVLAPATRIGTRIDQNLSYVFPEMPVAARARIAREAADGIGRTTAEFYSGRELMRRMARVTPTGPGLAALQAARAEGRPVLLMSAHFGNYFAARACLLARGIESDGFIRPMANPLVNRHYVAAMEALGGEALLQGPAGIKGLISALRRGRAVMLLNDLYVGTGVELPFLGRPAMTSTAPAEIAARTDALMIPVFGIRRPDGLSFDVALDAPLPQGDVLQTTRAYNAAVEARIRAHPGQWLWSHRRWKRKWNKGKDLPDDLHPAELPARRARL